MTQIWIAVTLSPTRVARRPHLILFRATSRLVPPRSLSFCLSLSLSYRSRLYLSHFSVYLASHIFLLASSGYFSSSLPVGLRAVCPLSVPIDMTSLARSLPLCGFESSQVRGMHRMICSGRACGLAHCMYMAPHRNRRGHHENTRADHRMKVSVCRGQSCVRHGQSGIDRVAHYLETTAMASISTRLEE